MGRKVIEDDVDFLPRVGGNNLVYEIEELDPAPSLIMTARDLASGNLQGGEQRRGAMPLIIVRLADHRAATWQLEIALGALERLDRGLLVDRQDDGILRRGHIKADDLCRFGHE